MTIRKIRPSRILPAERELLVRLAGELAAVAVIVDVDGDSLVVYASSVDPAAGARLTKLFGLASGGVNDPLAVFQSHARYAPELRFSLTNEDHRLYSAERWCYRGGIDDGLCLWGVKSLETLARKYLPHLGQESFFELI